MNLVTLDQLASCICDASNSTLILTGGESAGMVYKLWSRSEGIMNSLNSKTIYLSDERILPAGDSRSNFFTIQKYLYNGRIPNHVNIFRMVYGDVSPEGLIRNYQRLLPDKIDLLLLSLGDDGHVASLFPNGPELYELKNKVAISRAPKDPRERLTITRNVINSANNVFVLVMGGAKLKVFEKLVDNPQDIDSMPGRLLLNHNWIICDEGDF